MLLRLDENNDSPLYSQIASGVRRAILDGDIDEGDRLPPARDLALALDVNMHTVLRAYADLRQERIIEMRRGRGSVVRQDARSRANLITCAHDLIAEARRQGLNRDELIALLRQEMT